MLLRCILLTAVLFAALGATTARGQSLLLNPSFFSTVAGLNTVPDHGDSAVSYLDYRNAGYSIIAVDVPSGIEHQLERVFYAEPVVSTFGDLVTWIGYTAAGPADVYVHDREAQRTTRLTSDAAFQNHPDLSANIVVWQDYRNAGTDGMNADVYMHDFASNTTSPVTTDPGYQDLPHVHGRWVVWQDYRHSGDLLNTADIFAYDLVTKQERRLTAGSVYRTHPAVAGDLVVWEDYRNGSDGDIYLYDLSTGEEVPIATNPAHQGHPSVYGDWVLWLDYRSSADQADIYGYNLSTHQEYPLLIHPAHQEAPHVYGNHVVWQDYREGGFDLFAATLIDPTSTGIRDRSNQGAVKLSVAPNPFTDSVMLTLEDAPAVPLELTIYDALGRAVARNRFSSVDGAVSWDGRSDDGRRVAAGVYIAVVTGGDILKQTIFVRHNVKGNSE